MSKVVAAHIRSLETTVASLKEERNRIDNEIRLLEAALSSLVVKAIRSKNNKAVPRPGTTQHIAFSMLSSNSKVTISELMARAKVTRTAAQQALYKLKHKHLAKQVGRGVFSLYKQA